MHFFAAKLLSIAITTYTYVTSETYVRDDPINLLRTQRINFSMRPQHERMARDPTVVFDVSFLGNSCKYPHTLYITRIKLESLNYTTAAMIWIYLYFPAYSWVLAKRLLSGCPVGWLVSRDCRASHVCPRAAEGRQARVCVPCVARRRA